MTMTTLTAGNSYEIGFEVDGRFAAYEHATGNIYAFDGDWTDSADAGYVPGEGDAEAEGRSVADYFDATGAYCGWDEAGVEPVFLTCKRGVTILEDNRIVGEGVLDHVCRQALITDCAAVLDDDVYEALNDAIDTALDSQSLDDADQPFTVSADVGGTHYAASVTLSVEW